MGITNDLHKEIKGYSRKENTLEKNLNFKKDIGKTIFFTRNFKTQKSKKFLK